MLTLTLFLLLGAFVMPVAPGSAADDHAVHPHAKELKNEDGSWKYTNALAKESSPYLLQHAHNPVQWYAWGPEAFEKARKEGKPIFLSIGYSTCYWCHVMERLCFENPAIAKVMNEHCINIKVDREERPDVDDIYMASVQLLNNGRGGWPMSVFLTPPGAGGKEDLGLKPFYAGTYIPPQTFPTLIARVSEVWKEQKANVVAQGDQVAEAISQHLNQQFVAGDVPPVLVENTTQLMLGTFDADHGGFGNAPKFPTPNNLQFLLKSYQTKPSDALWHVITYTLERMARGGIYDQVGGGFHRYSVDEKWLVPHFEKMLYDNAQLVESYLTANAIKPDAKDPQLYPRVVRQVCDYVLREMLDETGTFWSAQDAEVDAKEGDNYVWTPAQVKKAITDEKLAAFALKMYGLDEGPNFRDPHVPNAPAVNVIFLPQRLDELAASEKMSLDELLVKKAQIDRLLKAVRDGRKQPRTDDKVLTSWNGLMIAALARAGRDLKDDRYTSAAAKAATYILQHMRNEDGGLFRTMRQGKAKINGFLEDYSFFCHGLVELYRSTDDTKFRDAAVQLTAYAAKQFAAEGGAGGYFDTLADQRDLFVRVRSTYDGATPSGNSVMVHNLISLHAITKDEKYLKDAVVDLRAFSTPLRRQTMGMAHMLHAFQRALDVAPQQFAVVTETKPVEPTAKEPVVVAIDLKQVDLKSGTATLKITIKMFEKYHVNAAEPGDENIIPLKVTLEGARGVDVKVTYPDPVKKKFAFADEAIAVHEGTMTVEVTLTKGKMPAAAGAKLLVQYQACNDDACLEPKSVFFLLELSGLD
ncbi:MAG: DUF255 domain-containing protein [Phycisphaeraceae bacterium]